MSKRQVDEFHSNGMLVLKRFYDPAASIEPIQRGIHRVIGLLTRKYGLGMDRPDFSPETFDSGFQELIAADRRYGAEVYDAVKQVPALLRLVSDPLHEKLFMELRKGSYPAVAMGGYGIRIDNPLEDRFKANWHQEYPAQLRSPDGIAFWTPLVPVTPELGPVRLCVGSHLHGPVPVLTRDPRNPSRQGAYSLALKNESELLGRYEHVAPLTEPGDLLVIDFMTLHASGDNRSGRSRWTVQFRYFNFNDATGLAHGWKGSYAAGIDFRSVHPELCAD